MADETITVETDAATILAKLSLEDRQSYLQDMMIFGTAAVKVGADGSHRYVPLRDVQVSE